VRSCRTQQLRFALTEKGAQVTIRVYDVSGRLVRVVENAKRAPGNYAVTWDGKDSTGRRVAAGVYLSQIRAGNQAETQLVVLLAD